MNRGLISTNRNSKIDAIKGLAILLVVVGHSIQVFSGSGEYDNNTLFRVIYSFHMPLFMFLAGVVASYGKKPMGAVYIKNKFTSLVVPFTAWCIVSYFLAKGGIDYGIFGYIYDIFLSPEMGLWFLWVLFLAFCSLSIAKKAESSIGIYGYALVWFLITAMPTSNFGIGLLKWHLPFFFLGYIAFSNKKMLLRYKKIIYAFGIIAFPILAINWYRLSTPGYVLGVGSKLSAHGFGNILVATFININTSDLATLIYRYLVPLSGICFTFWVFSSEFMKKTYKYLAFLGIYSLDIYVLHLYLFRLNLGSSTLNMVANSVFATVLSLLISIYVIRKVKILNKILLGGRV